MDPTLAASAADALRVVGIIPLSPGAYTGLSDSELLSLSSSAAMMQRAVSSHAALLAGEIARRSDHALGSAGLAQRSGFRTAEELVRVTSGSTSRDAVNAVRVGTLIHDAALPDPRQPWLAPVCAAVVNGSLSVASADAIRTGLGVPTADVPASVLLDAAVTLCREALTLDADRLQQRSRQLRDEIDEAGIADRETARRERRSLRLTRLPDGMSLLVWRLDPESAAICAELIDRATSPRRGGPRFVAPEAADLAASIAEDPRTTEQLASDVFLELLRHGSDADSARLLGSGAPVVRAITVAGSGHGFLEGQLDAVSAQTLDRLTCAGATQSVSVDTHGQPLDLSREQRLFSSHQRIALAVRDGGCRWPGCERPPSWTEAHHTQFWARDKGKTDLANGILLCRHHHLLLHNNHWEIRMRGAEHWLVPPAAIDASRTPRLMPTKSLAIRELAGARRRG